MQVLLLVEWFGQPLKKFCYLKIKSLGGTYFMEKIAVVYWSQSGNTETMAHAIVDGIKTVGVEVMLYHVSDFNESILENYKKVAFGCPSMGVEVLEEDEFEPFFTSVENKIFGKNIALFGSYGWGDGEWMRNWEERVNNSNAILFENGKIVNEDPNESEIIECFEFGKRFAFC